MNSFINFVSDSKVHDSILMTMIVTSFLGAIRRINDASRWWQIGWNFFYDWINGFWSMKTGQKPKSDPTQPVSPAQK